MTDVTVTVPVELTQSMIIRAGEIRNGALGARARE
jgi:hypothetical protein